MYHHLDTTKKQFIGKHLKAVSRVNDSSVRVEFCCGPQVVISVDGDCCSQSIFYEIEVPPNAIGAKLLDIIEREFSGESLSSGTADSEEVALEKIKRSGIDFHPEENSVWNVVFVTDRGNVLLRHINSSNGYYDGCTSYEVAA